MQNISKREYYNPVKIIKASLTTGAEYLIDSTVRQAAIDTVSQGTNIMPQGDILMDFGKELCGGVRIITGNVYLSGGGADTTEGSIDVVFGESVAECLAAKNHKGAGNYHSPRDYAVGVCAWGDITTGNTGFRFVRLTNSGKTVINIRAVLAELRYDGYERAGYFRCDNMLLNDIFDTAAYTVKLCMQNNVIWDGIKRDRLVWAGDLHPEILAVMYLYGAVPSVKNTINHCIETTSPNSWINMIPSYSVWWLILVSEYYRFTADSEYVLSQMENIQYILYQIKNSLSEDGQLDFHRAGYEFFQDTDMFLDWPTVLTADAEPGVRALFVMGLTKTAELIKEHGMDNSLCLELIERLHKRKTYEGKAKQVVAMRLLSCIDNAPGESIGLLTDNGPQGLSCFMSYYILTAIAGGGKLKDAVNIAQDYFGGMLTMGATTFWEDFDTEWMKNSFGIDKLGLAGQTDIHGDFGRYCYKGYRHSLCHGWAAGVLPFLVEQVAGIKVLDSQTYQIDKQSAMDVLKEIKCGIPTQSGIIHISKTLDPCGEVRLEINAPEEIKIIIA